MIRLWTDASTTPNGSGWAFVAEKDFEPLEKRSGRIANCKSSLKSELTAIRKALEWLDSLKLTNSLVMTDCEAAMVRIAEEKGETAQKISFLLSMTDSQIKWCKGHDFYGWNCEADRMAREKANNPKP